MADFDMDSALDRINSLFLYGNGWNETHARKAHVDAFGREIPKGAWYYSRKLGCGYGNCLRLSEESMLLFLKLTFVDSPVLSTICDKLKGIRDEKAAEVISSLNFGED